MTVGPSSARAAAPPAEIDASRQPGTAGPPGVEAEADALEAHHAAELDALLASFAGLVGGGDARPLDPAAALACLADLDLLAIAGAWTVVRRRLGGEGKGDPVAELTYGLERAHFERWPRECLATIRMIPAVDRVVRIVELTTPGYVREVSAESAWHAFLLADSLPPEAVAYLRAHAGGAHWRELVQRVPREAIAARRRSLDPARDAALRARVRARREGRAEPEPVPPIAIAPAPAPRTWVVEGVGQGVRIERDRAWGLVHATADRLELSDVAWALGGVRLRAARVEARGVMLDGRAATATAPAHEAALLARVETLALHDVALATQAGELTCARIDVRALVVILGELPGSAGSIDDPPARRTFKDAPGELAPVDTLAQAWAAVVEILGEAAAGPLIAGVGGGRVTIGGVSARAGAWSRAGGAIGGARAIDLGGVDLRLDKTPTPPAQAKEVAAFVAAYRRQREDGPDASWRDAFFAMRRALEGAVVGEIATLRIVSADAPELGLVGGRVEIAHAAVTLRSRALACRHVGHPMAVTDALEGVTRDLAPQPAPLELELALGDLALTEGRLARGATRVVVGPTGARLADVRFVGRVPEPAARPTWSRLSTGAAACDVEIGVEAAAHAEAVVMWAGARVDHGERDTRVSVSDVRSPELVVRGATAGAPSDWRRTWPELTLRRVAGVGLEATWLEGPRTATFTLTLGQAEVERLGWPGVAGAPALARGATLGAGTARGTVLTGPWHLVIEEARLGRVEASGVERVPLGSGGPVGVGRCLVEDVRLRGAELPRPRAPRATSVHVARASLTDLVRGRGSVTLSLSALALGRAPDGRLSWTSGPLAASGVLKGVDGEVAAQGSVALEGLKGSSARDRGLSAEAASGKVELHVGRGQGAGASLDLELTMRAPAIVGGPAATLGLRFDTADIMARGELARGPHALGARLDARGVTARAELSLGSAPRLVVRGASIPKAQLEDARASWAGGALVCPLVRFERAEVRDLTLARDGGRVRLEGGHVQGGGVVIERARATLASSIEATLGSWRSSALDARLAPPTRTIGLGDVHLGALGLITSAGAVELASLRLSELAVDERAGVASARARSAALRVAPDQPARPAGGVRGASAHGVRATLDVFDHLHGEIGLVVPIGNERISGQLIVEPHGVDVAPTLVASHALQEQYWGWAPRWLVSRLVVSATRYVADFFERELAVLGRRVGARIEGIDDRDPLRLVSEGVARQLVDAMVRWSSAVDVLTPRGRGPLAGIGDPSEIWLAPAAEAHDPGADRRLQDIAAWARAIGLAVGIQATGVARLAAPAPGGPTVEARVGASLTGTGTLGSGLNLSIGANLSHIAARVGGLALRATSGSLEEGGRSTDPGFAVTALDVTLGRAVDGGPVAAAP